MASPEPLLIVFVHGWGATGTAAYGGLPAALAGALGERGEVVHIELGRYVSFRDEVTLPDLARAFDAALAELLAGRRHRGRVACIAHSTGGPLLREWLHRHVEEPRRPCPVSHLVMLAPANFGSALAQLGKSRLAALAAWFGGIEPGQGVLDWLELGSDAGYRLAHAWLSPERPRRGWPWLFVLSGDGIDRRLYDHVNAYTGETGSDGVVRLASANLNASYLRLRQDAPRRADAPAALRVAELRRARPTAFRILPGVAHTGPRMGIMTARDPRPTLEPLLRCLAVRDPRGYRALTAAFAHENAVHQDVANRVEVQRVPLLPDRVFIHDPHAMLVVRIFDQSGARPGDADVLLTGPGGDPDRLPRGFLTDRQGNSRHPGVVTFHLNLASLAGSPAVVAADGRVLRPALPGGGPYGLLVRPRGGARRVVGHVQGRLDATELDLLDVLHPNETTILDIVMHRTVRRGAFRLGPADGPTVDFRREPMGDGVV
ncbi:esterase/lipase family protein [Coralloluteibacterium thermophilus]|uniref:Esterase/lipase family protein n=1 Tax=Coralloluteibacterium thermophilum TaxID=2707049 RepID=A0ABV9NKT0_9GAMM